MYRNRETLVTQIRKRFKEQQEKAPKGRIKRIGGLPGIASKRQHYENKQELQKGICPICERPLSKNRRQRHHDHCHLTNKLRGVLCVNCNILLGNANDDIKILERAIKYLDLYRDKLSTVVIDDREPGTFIQHHPSWTTPIVPIPLIKQWWHGLPDVIDLTAFKASDITT